MMAQNLKHYQTGTNVTTSGVYYTSGIPYNLIASPFASGWFNPSRAGITNGIHTIRYCFQQTRRSIKSNQKDLYQSDTNLFYFILILV